MSTLYLIVFFSLAVAVLLLMLKFRRDLLYRYWKYITGAGISLVAIVFVAGKLKKSPKTDPKGDKKKEELDQGLEAIEKEANKEIEEATAKEEEVKTELSAIKEISDEEERLRQLSDLFNKTRR